MRFLTRQFARAARARRPGWAGIHATGILGRPGSAAVILGLMLGMAARAEGAFVDQSNAYPGSGPITGRSISVLAPVGQSFTPISGAIDFATFNLRGAGSPAGTFAVELHAGATGTGALLGTSNPVTLAANFGSSSTLGSAVEFDFASTVSLTPQTLYSLVVRRVDSSSAFLLYYGANNYAGGTGIAIGIATMDDTFFNEGTFAAASVPEPSSLKLCGMAGLVGLVAARARRREGDG